MLRQCNKCNALVPDHYHDCPSCKQETTWKQVERTYKAVIKEEIAETDNLLVVTGDTNFDIGD